MFSYWSKLEGDGELVWGRMSPFYSITFACSRDNSPRTQLIRNSRLKASHKQKLRTWHGNLDFWKIYPFLRDRTAARWFGRSTRTAWHSMEFFQKTTQNLSYLR